jgi:hypothetical protein
VQFLVAQEYPVETALPSAIRIGHARVSRELLTGSRCLQLPADTQTILAEPTACTAGSFSSPCATYLQPTWLTSV